VFVLQFIRRELLNVLVDDTSEDLFSDEGK